jgi:uncharacterized membrane protein YfcA
MTREWFGLAMFFILLGLANIGGIGGGGLIIPICIAMFGTTTRQAVALSNSTIFWGSFTRFFFFSIYDKNPDDEGKTLIDYSISSVMLPMVLVGSYAGILVSILLPEVAMTTILTLLLIFLTYSTIKKGIEVYRKESVDQQAKIQEANDY